MDVLYLLYILKITFIFVGGMSTILHKLTLRFMTVTIKQGVWLMFEKWHLVLKSDYSTWTAPKSPHLLTRCLLKSPAWGDILLFPNTHTDHVRRRGGGWETCASTPRPYSAQRRMESWCVVRNRSFSGNTSPFPSLFVEVIEFLSLFVAGTLEEIAS